MDGRTVGVVVINPIVDMVMITVVMAVNVPRLFHTFCRVKIKVLYRLILLGGGTLPFLKNNDYNHHHHLARRKGKRTGVERDMDMDMTPIQQSIYPLDSTHKVDVYLVEMGMMGVVMIVR